MPWALLLRYLPWALAGLALVGVLTWWGHHWSDYRQMQADVATLTAANESMQRFAGEQVRQRELADAAYRYRDALAVQDGRRYAAAIAKLRAARSAEAQAWRAAAVPADVADGLRALANGSDGADGNGAAPGGADGASAGPAVRHSDKRGLGGLFGGLRIHLGRGEPEPAKPAGVGAEPR